MGRGFLALEDFWIIWGIFGPIANPLKGLEILEAEFLEAEAASSFPSRFQTPNTPHRDDLNLTQKRLTALTT